jgi:thiamine-monophosphate kinase
MESEFSLISRYFERPCCDDDVVTGIGDDAAILAVPADKRLVVTTDTLIEGVHFPRDTRPADIGHKALAVSLSDIAAMGAVPRWATLALTLPEANKDWLSAFADGLFSLADEYDVRLVGGDTTRGQVLSITLQLMGLVSENQVLKRAGAQVGDYLYVSGCLGNAGLALAALSDAVTILEKDREKVMAALNTPSPRVRLGQQLGGIASAAIDISDGLCADLQHLLSASHVGAVLDLANLPLSQSVQQHIQQQQSWHLPLAAGDDYELCFTVPEKQQDALSRTVGEGVFCIGRIVQSSGIQLRFPAGDCVMYQGLGGYNHFS